MKKALAILAIATLVACVNPASTEAPAADSTVVTVDSTKVDSVAAPVADSTTSAVEAK